MTTLKTFITRHPVASYFALTFAISWGGVLLVIGGPSGIRGATTQNDPLFPLVYLAMLAGPSVSGILLTGVIHGRAGLHEFASRLLKWRLDARWHAVAILTAPLLAVGVTALLVLSLRSPEFLARIFTTNDRASVLLFGLVVGLGAGVFEELGWTGFAGSCDRRHGWPDWLAAPSIPPRHIDRPSWVSSACRPGRRPSSPSTRSMSARA